MLVIMGSNDYGGHVHEALEGIGRHEAEQLRNNSRKLHLMPQENLCFRIEC